MKKVNIILTVLVSMFLSNGLFAQEDDRTLSPYFMVKSIDPETDALPLQSTKADVSIAGVIADVTVTQVYKNEGKNPLECTYVFPASTRAAVYGMKMTIGSRVVIAEVKEKKQAKKEYEQAKSEGKRASLLEQHRPNVFQMNVANIMPGDVIKVELQYTELLVPTDGEYEFVYPTVVGPRYNHNTLASADNDDKFVATPYTKEGEEPLYDFDLNVQLNAGMPIQNIDVGTHKTSMRYPNPKTAIVNLDKSEAKGGNRDYILKYKLQGGEIESGLLLFEGEKENFFLLMVQPPKKVEPKHIPAREYIFIVDVSGSMRGFPLNTSKKLLRNLIINLRPTDMFNVMLFSGGNSVMSEHSVPATEINIQRAVNLIDSYRGGGGTQLLPAMQRAIDLPREEGLSRSMVIVTDGYVSCEPEAFDLISKSLNKSNVFPFGIGSSVNRHLIDGLANVGMGEPAIVTSPSNADEKAEKFRQYINSPVLTQVDVDFKNFEAYDVEPITVPDVLAERPVIIFGKYKGDAKGSITMKGYTGNKKKYKKVFEVAASKADDKNAALKYLWARKRIQRLDDYKKLNNRNDAQLIAEITQLGLDYNLLTAYTSFIAVDKQIANNSGELKSVKQALPLPQGVPNSAVGFDLKIAGVSKAKKSKITLSSLTVKNIMSDIANATQLENALNQKVKELKLTLSGSIKVKLSINEKGEVTKVELQGGELNDADKKQLESLIKQWVFKHLALTQITDVEFEISK